jgi:hypothetical protein
VASEAVPSQAVASEIGASQDLPPGSAPRRRRRVVHGLGVACLPLAALTWALLWRAGRQYVSSDSVAQQSILQTWWLTGHGTTYLPPDTWLLKLPAYLLVEPLPLGPDLRLLLESLLLGGAGLALTALAARRLGAAAGPARRWWDAALPVAWLALLGGGLGQYLAIMPNSRNVELGLVFVVLVVTAGYLQAPHRLRPRRWRRVGLGVLAAVGFAVLWVDDPYVSYLLGGALAAACTVWFVLRRRDPRLLVVAAVTAGSLALAPALRALLVRAGIVAVADTTGVTASPSMLVRHLGVLGPALATQVGLQDRGPTVWPAHVLTVLVLVAGVVMSGYLLVVGWRIRALALTFLGGHWVVVAFGVLANRGVYDFHAGRYLVLAVYDVAVVLGVGTALLRRHRPRLAAALTGLLVVAVAANVVSAAVDRAVPNVRVAKEDAILRTVQDHGLTKGYAEFWIADLFQYRSGGKVTVPEVICSDGQLWFRYWLTDTVRWRVHADRTFVLWDPVEVGLQGCTQAGIEAQLGVPAQRIPAAGGATVLVYDRDVGEKIRQSSPPQG